MRPALSMRFVEKAEAALSAAVEIYNKPAFNYREENFSLLMLNAWELLLKAKILADNNNKERKIWVYEKRQTQAGKVSKKLYLKRNRAGNPLTIGLQGCILELDKNQDTRLKREVKLNINALMEVRDNAAHFIHVGPVLAKQVLEIGTASIQNLVFLCKQWFARDLSATLSLILPLSFINTKIEAAVVSVSPDERNLIEYLEHLGTINASADGPFHVAVRLDVKLHRSKLDTASIVEVSNDPGAVKITLSEEDIRERYPWDYNELIKRLRARYSDFKANARFQAINKPLKSDLKYVRARLLDPGNPKSQRKEFYNPNVLRVFDAHYTRRV